MKAGDVCFLDRAVWHQAMPITDGIKWAIIIFFKVHRKPPKAAAGVSWHRDKKKALVYIESCTNTDHGAYTLLSTLMSVNYYPCELTLLRFDWTLISGLSFINCLDCAIFWVFFFLILASS